MSSPTQGLLSAFAFSLFGTATTGVIAVGPRTAAATVNTPVLEGWKDHECRQSACLSVCSGAESTTAFLLKAARRGAAHIKCVIVVAFLSVVLCVQQLEQEGCESHKFQRDSQWRRTSAVDLF